MRNISVEGQKRIEQARIICGNKSTERRLEREKKYYLNPNQCLRCNNIIPYKLRLTSIYCSSSCSAIENNKKRAKIYYCINCNTKCNKNAKKYCSNNCRVEHRKNILVGKWLTNPYSYSNGELPSFVRNYLIKLHDNKCEKCGWAKTNERTGLIPLTIHHKDGNYKNNVVENLEVLCPNCHSLTYTYGSANRGNGRKTRYR